MMIYDDSIFSVAENMLSVTTQRAVSVECRGRKPYVGMRSLLRLTLARAWGGDATPRQLFLAARYIFYDRRLIFLHSLLFNLFTQGLQVTSFYDLLLPSCDPVLKVMSRPI